MKPLSARPTHRSAARAGAAARGGARRTVAPAPRAARPSTASGWDPAPAAGGPPAAPSSAQAPPASPRSPSPGYEYSPPLPPGADEAGGAAAAAAAARADGAPDDGPAVSVPFDHYSALGLDARAGSHAIRRAAERLLRGAPTAAGFSQDALFCRELLLRRAAECLLDRGARAEYDAWLATAAAADADADATSGPAAAGPPRHALAARDVAGALALLQEAGEWGTVLAAADELLGDRAPAGIYAIGLFAARAGQPRPQLPPAARRDVAIAAARAAAAAGEALATGAAAGSPSAARRTLLHARARLAREAAGGAAAAAGAGAAAVEALSLQLRSLAADLAVPAVEEHLAPPRPSPAVAAAAAAADPVAAAAAVAGRADALRCLSGLLFGLGDHARLEGRARERLLRLVRGGLTAAEQVSLYESTPAGTVCPPTELFTTALALIAEGWRTQQPQLVRRAARLLATVAGADGAPDAADAAAACALMLGDPEPAAARAGDGGDAQAWASAWLAGAVLAEWPECRRGLEGGAGADAEGAPGGGLAIDLQRDWFEVPHVGAIIKLASVSPGAGLLDFLDAAGAAASQMAAPIAALSSPTAAADAGAAAAGAAASARATALRWLHAARGLAERASDAAARHSSDAGTDDGGRRLRGVLGWTVVAAFGLAAIASANGRRYARGQAALAADSAPAAVMLNARHPTRPRAAASAAAAGAAALAPVSSSSAAAEAEPATMDEAAAAALLTEFCGARAAALGPERDASRLEGAMGGDLLELWQQQARLATMREEHFELRLSELQIEALEPVARGRVYIQARLREAGRQLLAGDELAAFEGASTLQVEAAWGPAGWRVVRVAALPPLVL
ncbi:hypothetical protein Rsub_01106 [Raphidocelis subcapitata]|uniref:Uncharacterized protein n=1 Tax=Raphidocelis subcapitata TaxID=307507 RepID=A0A2V0NLS6_9CHLO|nr:hypothetical protein Rsub_01106 [Raphidocelis subcapitata]|eukprot:GBF88394.1 hypothetical protein Rsub_01106 [Raphidocelis subcapitata]